MAFSLEFWWIDTFRLNRGDFYRWSVWGENCVTPARDYGQLDRRYCWRVPNLKGGGGRFAFRLRVVEA